ncbi:hypothetical protein L9F63_018731, partial [Diploptera punctata]
PICLSLQNIIIVILWMWYRMMNLDFFIEAMPTKERLSALDDHISLLILSMQKMH